MDKKIIMESLCISEEDLEKRSALVTEKCFCAALLQQPTNIIANVLADYISFRDTLYPEDIVKRRRCSECEEAHLCEVFKNYPDALMGCFKKKG